MSSKVATMRDAVAELVRDGDTVAIEGFTHLISFAAGHEIIRQRRRDLVLARMTPDVIYDQMVAGGVARKLIFSWLGNPGVGGLNAIRRVTEGPDATLELEEYSHFGMVARYAAGAATNPDPEVFAYAAAQVKKAMDVTRQLGGENYVLWGGREGYDTLLNTDLRRERAQLGRFMQLVADYKKSRKHEEE